MTILSLPILAAVWGLSWFVIQDGPLYIYNAHILVESLRSNSIFHQFYALRWYPLPYWGAYALLMGLLPVLPERLADQILITLCSVGFVAALAWLRWRVVGWQGMAVVAPIAVLLSMNMHWLFGLYSFLLGACLYLITLGVWWKNRDQLGLKRSLLLSLLLIAGYFCHLVSVGITVIGLGVLAVMTPGAGWFRRVFWTALSILPLVPLMLMYRSLMQSAGEVQTAWGGLTDPLSVKSWLWYFRLADFLLLQYPGMPIPEGGIREFLFNAPEPSIWAGIGLLALLIAPLSFRGPRDRSFIKTHRGWIILVCALIGGGFFGPSAFGEGHGGFLRERLLFVGFATLAAIMRVKPKRILTWIGMAGIIIALALQMGLMWDYALTSNRCVSAFMEVKPYVGTGKRVAALMVNPGGRFRASPMPHISNMLGVRTSNLVWNNYGPAIYFFPIRFLREEDSRLAEEIGNNLQFYDFLNPETVDYALDDWESLMEESQSQIDVLVVWHATPEIDEINRQWFNPHPVFANEDVKVLVHSPTEKPPQ